MRNHKLNIIYLTTILVFTFAMIPASVQALEMEEATDKGGDKKGVLSLVYGLKNFIDSAAVRGTDPNYIQAPKRPWQIILKSNVNQTILQNDAHINGEEFFGEGAGFMDWRTRIKTDPSMYVGIWAGYRGYGLGYFKNVVGDGGSYLTLGATGGRYGVNVRIHNFETDEATIRFKGKINEEPFDVTEKGQLSAPVSIHTVIADGYYLFNGKRFSYAAAYDQSVEQIRSSGSFMVGGMFYYLSVDFAEDKNAPFIRMMNNVGRFKQWQGGIGAGYAYNYVPFKGMLINAMAMPILAFYNRNTAYLYETNMGSMAEDFDEQSMKIKEVGKSSKTNNMAFNFNARISLVYNWKRFFVNAMGQFYNFRFTKDDYSGWLDDWYVNLSLGIRL